MKPWVYDANNFNPSDDAKNYIFMTYKVKQYLEVGDHETNFFLVGPKGLGKTLLLRYKSYKYRELGGFKMANPDQLTDNLNLSYGSFSKEELMQYKDYNQWTDIWRFCLLIVCIKTYGLKLDPKLEKEFGDVVSVSPVITTLLTNRNKLKYYLKQLPSLLNQLPHIKSGIALFIDNLDQQLDSILTQHSYTDYDKEGKNAAVEIWVNAQLGLAHAIYILNRSNNHIKIFATIRSEAFKIVLPGGLRQNLSNYTTELDYSKEDIKEIFVNNIRMMYMDENFDRKTSSDALIERFLGFSEMQHPFAKNENGEKRFEHVFDFLYRHSYGRPREVVRFGNLLLNNVLEQAEFKKKEIHEKIIQVRLHINKCSGDLFTEYKQEIIPHFDDTGLSKLLNSVKMNVIYSNNLATIDADAVRMLYSLGLLGYTTQVADSANHLVQLFLPPAQYNYTEQGYIPKSDYYVTHPTLDAFLMQRYGYDNFYNRTSIIGHRNLFYPPINTALNITITEELQGFYPKKLRGNHWLRAGEGHRYPIKDYYDTIWAYYSAEKINKIYDEAATVLQHIIKTYCAHVINKSFNKLYNDKESQKFLRKSHINRYYRSPMNDLSQNCLNLFENRLFGRMLVLGCYLFFDLECTVIHGFLVTGTFDFDIKRPNDAPFRYLQSAFFIEGLIDDSQPAQRNNSKRIIWENLSNYEQESLRNWHQNLQNEFKNWLDPYDFSVFLNEMSVSKWLNNTD